MELIKMLYLWSILDVDDTQYSISGAYAMQVLDMFDMISIIRMDYTIYFFCAYAMELIKMLDMWSILDVDDTQYSISGAYALLNLNILDMRSILEMNHNQ